MKHPSACEEQRAHLRNKDKTPGITGQLDLEVRLEMVVVMMMMSRMATVHYYCMERYYVTCAFWWQIGTCHARSVKVFVYAILFCWMWENFLVGFNSERWIGSLGPHG